ncbi:VanZ family protein [Microbacterium sp. MC2]
MPDSSPPSTSGPRHFLVRLLAVGYGGFVAFVVFWPSPIDRPVAGMLDRVIAELHERGVPGFVDYAFIEFSANVALFIPLGILFGLALPMTWWAVMLLLGPALSGFIELVQSVVLAERYASVHDVIANSIGATIGVLLALTLRAVVAQRDDRVIERWEFERARA